MKINIENDIFIFGNIYHPVEIKEEPSKNIRNVTITYCYLIDKNTPDNEQYTVYTTHTTEFLDLFLVDVRKGKYNITTYENDDTARRNREYAGAFSVDINRLNEEIEDLIINYLKNSDIVKWFKSLGQGEID